MLSLMLNVKDEQKMDRMRILLADDKSEVRSALRLLLEQDPLPDQVAEVSSAQELFADLRENCPTAVLIDWELPGIPMRELLPLLRSYCPGMKVIAMSSRFEARQEALIAGTDAFISKAEPPEYILATLYALLIHAKK